ncbi:MAG: AAA family ATPase [Bacteroidota bacterium]
MDDLLNTFSPYGEFLKDRFFTQTYGRIASRIMLDVPLEANRDNMTTVKEMLAETGGDFQVVYKNWTIGNTNKAEDKDDYEREFFYHIPNKRTCVWVSLHYEKLLMEFLYREDDQANEQWVLDVCKTFRSKFGKEKGPTFKVLSKGGGQFYTEEININAFDVDVNKLYNDDFAEIHRIIDESLAVDNSGLILFHGPPGTGKTSYIKHLLDKHNERNFIFIPNDFVNELLQPDFISFLITSKNSILVIEDAEKVITSRENASTNSVVSTILQLTDGLFSDYLNIKIICTFNTSIEKVDKALFRKGRMIAFYEFKALSLDKTNALRKSLDQGEGNEPMTLAEIFNLDKESFEDSSKGKRIGF